MTNRQLDDIIELITSYCVTEEDYRRIQDNITILIENLKDEEDE